MSVIAPSPAPDTGPTKELRVMIRLPNVLSLIGARVRILGVHLHCLILSLLAIFCTQEKKLHCPGIEPGADRTGMVSGNDPGYHYPNNALIDGNISTFSFHSSRNMLHSRCALRLAGLVNYPPLCPTHQKASKLEHNAHFKVCLCCTTRPTRDLAVATQVSFSPAAVRRAVRPLHSEKFPPAPGPHSTDKVLIGIV